MAKVELEEMELNDVVGGAFNYYDNGTVMVDGIGTFNCIPNAKKEVIKIIVTHPDWSAQQVVDQALADNIFY